MSQNFNYQRSNFSINFRSHVYKDHQKMHPTIELILNEDTKVAPDQIINKGLKSIRDPSLLVFDSKLKTPIGQYDIGLREVNESEGLFYFLLQRPDIGILNNKKRIFRILVCVTVYSETYDDLQLTLNGIYTNLEIFRQQARISNEDVAVVVIFDGCEQIDTSIEDYFSFLDKELEIPEEKTYKFRKNIFLNEGSNPQYANYPKTSCFTYQYHLYANKNYKLKKVDQKQQNYLQIFFSIKLQNNGKLSSHAFFFRGFCELFNPHYCVLLDCGTFMESNALYNCFKALECDKQIGGCCGFMQLRVESILDSHGKREDAHIYDQYDFATKIMNRIFDVQKAQQFEYTISHVMDKSFESLFGFIHVLPGAFSVYRWESISYNKESNFHQDNMLEQTYLISVLNPDFKLNPEEYTIETANMMLAEDRILCLEIYCRKNYFLKYIPDAVCYTDPIKYLIMLMKQRRRLNLYMFRWINGSWFALNHVIKKFPRKIASSEHTTFNKFLFFFNMFYSAMNQMITYVTISLFFVFLNFFSEEFLSEYNILFNDNRMNIYQILVQFYGIFIFTFIFINLRLILFSLFTQKVEKRTKVFSVISTYLGLYMMLNYAFVIWIIAKIFFFDSYSYQILAQKDIVYVKFLISTNIVGYAIPCLFKYKQIFTNIIFCLPHYIYYSPAYIHTLLIYAFCNLDDLSWGTKGLDGQQEIKLNDKQENRKVLEADLKQKIKNQEIIKENFQNFKINFIFKFIGINTLIAWALLVFLNTPDLKKIFVMVFASFFTINMMIRSISALIYNLKYYFIEQRYYDQKIKKKCNQYGKEGGEMRKYIQMIMGTPGGGTTTGDISKNNTNLDLVQENNNQNNTFENLLNNQSSLKMKQFEKKSLTIQTESDSYIIQIPNKNMDQFDKTQKIKPKQAQELKKKQNKSSSVEFDSRIDEFDENSLYLDKNFVDSNKP